MNQKTITRRKLITLVPAADGASLMAACAPVSAMPASAEEKLVGSWISEYTAQVQQAQFPVLFTFNTDGSLLASTGTPGQSTGQGAWARGRHGEIGYTFVVLLSDPAWHEPPGRNMGQFVMAGTLQRDASKDSWSGPFKITVSDASGQVFFNETGTLELTQRIAVEPLT